MAADSDDNALGATVAAPSGGETVASIRSGGGRAHHGSMPPADAAALGPVDPAAYVRGKVLATGGMGRIVAAHDRRLGRPVALKETRTTNHELRARFMREVKLTARLQHPNIITVHEAGVWPDGEPFFAMKLVAGRSLDKVVADATTLQARLALLPTVIAVADALAYAHRERVIHRDLKPANVLVGDFGETVVIDWGLAKDLDSTEPVLALGPTPDGAGSARPDSGGGETALGAVIGTPAYMPPEQARGEQVDERADVYALGALAYHVLCGRAPVEGKSIDELIANAKDQPVPAPRTLDSRIPRELDTIVTKAMAADPAARYPTAVELVEDLRRFQTGQLVGAHHYTNWQLVARWVRRFRTPLVVAAIALAVIIIGGAYSVSRVLGERDAARESAREADDSLETLLVEQGRREALDHHPLRALALLAEVVRRWPPDDDVRYLLGRLVPVVEPVVFRAGSGVSDAAFVDGDHHVMTASNDGLVRVLDAQTGALVRTHDVHSADASIELGPTDAVAALTLSPPDDGPPFKAIVELATGSTSSSRRASTVVYNETGTRAWSLGSELYMNAAGQELTLEVGWYYQGVLAARARGDDLLIITSQEVVHLHADATRIVMVSTRRHAIDADRDPVKLTAAAISADLDHLVVVWDHGIQLETGDGVMGVQERGTYGADVAIRDDGSQVALVEASQHIELLPWVSTQRGARVTMPASDDEVGRLRYSRDGTTLLAVDVDLEALAIDTRSGAVIARLSAELGFKTAAINDDGSRVVAALTDGTVEVWQVTRAGYLPTLGDQVSCAAYDHEDHVVAFGIHGVVREGRSGAIPTVEGRDCTLDPSGHHMLTIGGGTLRVFDLDHDATPIVTIPLGDDSNDHELAIAEGGHRVAIARPHGTIELYTDGVRTLEMHRPEAFGTERLGRIAFSPDGSHLMVTGRDPAVVWIIDEHGQGPKPWVLPSLKVVRWSPDGTWLAAAVGNQVKLFSPATGPGIGLTGPSVIEDVAISPTTGDLFTAGADGVIRQYNSVGTQLSNTKPIAGALLTLAIDPDGKRIAAASELDVVSVWSVKTHERLDDLGVWQSRIDGVQFAHDSSRLLTWSDSGVVFQFAMRLDPHTSRELDALVTRCVPWSVDHGSLVPRELAR